MRRPLPLPIIAKINTATLQESDFGVRSVFSNPDMSLNEGDL